MAIVSQRAMKQIATALSDSVHLSLKCLGLTSRTSKSQELVLGQSAEIPYLTFGRDLAILWRSCVAIQN